VVNLDAKKIAKIKRKLKQQGDELNELWNAL
jgi:hypothetical protein